MSRLPALWSDPRLHLVAEEPEHPVLYFSPAVLQATARRFLSGFPGLVTYAVKANDTREVLENLVAAGLEAFDVASPAEMAAVRRAMPDAALHYNNPVRSRREIAEALRFGVVSWSLDCRSELEKLIECGVPTSAEISVRLRLPVPGAAYNFGSKFGADMEAADALLRAVAAGGYRASMTFHPGTQCKDPEAWAAYIAASAEVARRAGVGLVRLNVGGGFPSHRTGAAPELGAIFERIGRAAREAFGPDAPRLVCEPGRAMVAEAFTLATRVKALREDGAIFLNDGIYGGLAEAPSMGNVDRIEVVRQGAPIGGPLLGRTVFGPTCDSLDRLPGEVGFPEGIAEGDAVLFHGLGAYSLATVTRFNGYGALEIVTVERLS